MGYVFGLCVSQVANIVIYSKYKQPELLFSSTHHFNNLQTPCQKTHNCCYRAVLKFTVIFLSWEPKRPSVRIGFHNNKYQKNGKMSIRFPWKCHHILTKHDKRSPIYKKNASSYICWPLGKCPLPDYSAAIILGN